MLHDTAETLAHHISLALGTNLSASCPQSSRILVADESEWKRLRRYVDRLISRGEAGSLVLDRQTRRTSVYISHDTHRTLELQRF